jgi:hypothetical protein
MVNLLLTTAGRKRVRNMAKKSKKSKKDKKKGKK